MELSVTIASAADAANIADLLNEAARQLTDRYGKGHWSYQANEKGIISSMRGNTKVLAAKRNDAIVGTLTLTTRKPWAIDPAYFTQVQQPVYLVSMAVHPDWQHRGIGKYMLQEAVSVAASWPARAIRLDAYDAAAGAGGFYSKCGFTEKGRVVYRKNPLIYFERLL